jgi:membrane protein implicated in regulation of membrane protease activity
MIGFLDDLTGLEKFFAACAIVGGILLVFRLVLQFMGGHTGMDGADAGGADGGFQVGDSHGTDSDIGFKLLSFQGLTAFFLMFGLVGLALLRQSQVAAPLAVLGGTAAGFASVWVIREIYRFIAKLQASGTIDIQKAVGQEGTVYLNIPAGGTGQVQLSVQDHLKIYDAMAAGGQEIKTGSAVKVLRVQAGNVLIVKKNIESGLPGKES